VGHLGTDVEGERHGVEVVEVLGEALPPPADAGVQRRARDVLDALHEADEPLVPVGGDGSEPDAAVAHHHGGDPLPRRRRQQRVPGDLAVVVGVDVDPAGRHHQPIGVDRAGGRTLDVAHVGDDAVGDGDVGGAAGLPGAVDEVAVADDEVVHGVPLVVAARRRRRAG
jgi:hypothetical protein